MVDRGTMFWSLHGDSCLNRGFLSLNRGLSRMTRMTRILRMLLFVVAQFIAPLSESRIFADSADFADFILAPSHYCLNRGLSRISRMTRIIDFSYLNFAFTKEASIVYFAVRL